VSRTFKLLFSSLLLLVAGTSIQTLQFDLAEREGRSAQTIIDLDPLNSRSVLYAGLEESDAHDHVRKQDEQIITQLVDALEGMLDVPVEVKSYQTREQLIYALQAGKIDFFLGGNQVDAQDPRLILSTPYMHSQPAFYRTPNRHGGQRASPNGSRIAMHYRYLPTAAVTRQYPDAVLQLYSSPLAAAAAAALGRADLYLGDRRSSERLIASRHLNLERVELEQGDELPEQGYSLAVLASASALREELDARLHLLEAERMTRITLALTDESHPPQRLQGLSFNAQELSWLSRAPPIRVAINENALPLAYFDGRGEYQEMGIDVLRTLEYATGLRFQLVHGVNPDHYFNALQSGELDLVLDASADALLRAGITPVGPEFANPYVLMARTSRGRVPVKTLDDFSTERLAVPQRLTRLIHHLDTAYPGISLTTFTTADGALQALLDYEVNAAVTTAAAARRMLPNVNFSRIKIVSTVRQVESRSSFFVRNTESEWVSILDKTLQRIALDDYRLFTTFDDYQELSPYVQYWYDNKVTIQRIALSVTGIALLSGFWVVQLMRSIRKREVIQAQLEDQLAFIRVMLDGTPHPIYVRDRAGELVMGNVSYRQAMGDQRNDIIGTRVIDNPRLDPEQARQIHQTYLDAMTHDQPHICDREVCIDGRSIHVYHWVLPYADSRRRIKGVIGGWIDISERRSLLEQLRQATISAEHANRAKTSFLATMSHEIRTPLNAILGMLELAEQQASKGQVDGLAIRTASNEAARLLDLIGNVLDVVRIESGKLSLAPRRVNLAETVRSIESLFGGIASEKHIRLVFEIDPKADVDVLVDPTRLRQIVVNLLGNALKFTQAGQVRLRLVSEAEPDRLNLLISVDDTGPGICRASQKRLFNTFEQAEGTHGGTGLGLSICKTLCEMMGGTLRLISRPGVGTRVKVALSVATLPPQPLPDAPSRALAPNAPADASPAYRILVIDDHPPNRLLLARQLGHFGHAVTLAEDGDAGLAAWRKGVFDLVFIDGDMPTLTGYELAHEIRKAEIAEHRPHCILLGYTANAQLEELQRCIRAGMNDCLFKPVGLQLVGQRLSRYREYLANPRSTSPEAHSLSHLRSLMGGDEQAIQAILAELLEANVDDLMQLARLIGEPDLLALRRVVHRIKGAARMIGNRNLIEPCEALENLCVAGQDPALIRRHALGLFVQLSALDTTIREQYPGIATPADPAPTRVDTARHHDPAR